MKKTELNKFEIDALVQYESSISPGRNLKDVIIDAYQCSEFLSKSICIKDYQLSEDHPDFDLIFLKKQKFFSTTTNLNLRYPAIKHKIILSNIETIRHIGNVAKHNSYKVTKEDTGVVSNSIKSILKWYFSEKYDYRELELLPIQKKLISDLFKLDIEDQIKQEKNKYFIDQDGIIKFEKWNAKTNRSTPQWADYFNIPIIGFVKRIKCHVTSPSQYYRFGFKFFTREGKLFGDGSIQSQDNNFVMHLGKNYLSDELFITTYHNGILEGGDKYVNIKSSDEGLKIELFIDTENFLYFHINGVEVFKKIINKEILGQIYMLAWGDVSEYEVNVKNIEIEFDT